MPDLGQCRSCSAPIRWALTPKGKRMPVDVAEDPDGTVLVTTVAGVDYCEVAGSAEVAAEVVERVLDMNRRTGPDGLEPEPVPTRHTSHFATCPDAARHRRGKGRQS